MNRPLNERVYGRVPESFDQFLVHTLREESKARKTARIRPVLILALCLLLAAATALAVAHRVGLLDFYGHMGVDMENAPAAIATDIPSTGGETSMASFRVREAFYDGAFLRVLLEAKPTTGGVLLPASFMTMRSTLDAVADLPGTRYGVTASSSIPGDVFETTHAGGTQEGDSLALLLIAFLPSGVGPDVLPLDVDIQVFAQEDGSLLETTQLSFEIAKTTEPITRTAQVDVALDLVEISELSISATPMETSVRVTYTPLLRAFTEFTVVPKDGYVKKDGLPTQFSTSADGSHMTDPVQRRVYTLPASEGDATTLTLWAKPSKQAVVIDLETGEATIHTVELEIDGENTRVLLDGGMT